MDMRYDYIRRHMTGNLENRFNANLDLRVYE